MKKHTPYKNILLSLIFTLLAAISLPGCEFYDEALRELKDAKYDVYLLAKMLFLDVTPPAVTSIIPDKEASGVARNMTVSAIFSEDIDPGTVTSSSFAVTRATDGVAVDGTLRCVRNTVTFKPISNLESNTMYEVIVYTGLKDRAGNALEEQFSWFFKTGSDIDNVPPNVTYTFPSNHAVDAPTNTGLNAVFSENIDPSTVTNDTFIITGGGKPVEGKLSSIKNTIIFKPAKEMDQFKYYNIRVTTGIKDLAGNAMASEYSWDFSTSDVRDETPPLVTRTQPGNRETGVEAEPNINVVFSENIDPGTITPENIIVTKDKENQKIKGIVICNDTTVTFKPMSRLEIHTTYQVVITNNVTDMAGNRLKDQYKFTFTTGNGLDSTPPSVIEVYPTNTTVPLENINIIRVYLSEDIQFGVVMAVSYEDGENRIPVPGVISYNQSERILQFVPDSGILPSYRRYHVSVSSVKDLAGNPMSGEVYTWTFAIGPYMDTTPPLIDHVTPAMGSIINDDVTSVRVFFSEEIQPGAELTVVRENESGSTEVSGSVSYDQNQRILQFIPDSNIFERYSRYNVKLSDVMDLAGNPLSTASNTWSFVVGSHEVQLEPASNLNNGYGTFGPSGANVLLKNSGDPISTPLDYIYGVSMLSIFDTQNNGNFDASNNKYMRIVNKGVNIASASGLNLTPVAMDLAQIISPPSDMCYIDPLRGRFVLPRPTYFSQFNNPREIENPVIKDEFSQPYSQRSGILYYDGCISGKFGNSLFVSNSFSSITDTDITGERSIYPFGHEKLNYSKGTVSVWVRAYSFADHGAFTRGHGQGTTRVISFKELSSYMFNIDIDYYYTPDYELGSLRMNDHTESTCITNGGWHHIYVVWDSDGNLIGSNKVRVWIDGVERITVPSNGSLPDLSSAVFFTSISARVYGQGPTKVTAEAQAQMDNLKIFVGSAIEDPSWEYNNGVGRENALHPIYGPDSNPEYDYRPRLVGPDSGVGYYY